MALARCTRRWRGRRTRTTPDDRYVALATEGSFLGIPLWSTDVLTPNHLAVVDVSDPNRPQEVGFYTLLREAESVAVGGVAPDETHIHVARSDHGLVILRVRYQLFLPLVVRAAS